MKQQRRHELKTNELADQLGHYLQRVKPYSSQIATAAAAIAVLGLAFMWWNTSHSRLLGSSWSDFFRASATRDAESMGEVAKLHSGTPAAVWANLAAGDAQFSRGAGLMFSDRDEAEHTLKEARDYYLAAIEGGAEKSLWLSQRAHFGLGQTYEALCQVEKALEQYQQAAKLDESSAIGKVAKQRAQLMADDSVVGWYNWFERQEPPAPGDGTAPGQGPTEPDDLETLPDRPDLSYPGASSAVPSSGPAPTEQAPQTPPGAEPAASSGEPPAEDPQADSPEADETAGEADTEQPPAAPDEDKAVPPDLTQPENSPSGGDES